MLQIVKRGKLVLVLNNEQFGRQTKVVNADHRKENSPFQGSTSLLGHDKLLSTFYEKD